ncbi:hypothetical protein [Dokdonella sp.]|nr:hypothetical protein [Dokdonella sp.]
MTNRAHMLVTVTKVAQFNAPRLATLPARQRRLLPMLTVNLCESVRPAVY